jgi:CP2 transcription factor
MIATADEIPVTYLNKGQAYSVSIIDTAPAPTLPGPTPAQYRTSIRISFEDGQQGQRAAKRWRLWKEGRGTTEAHRRGGILQGVEYVEARDVTEDDSRTRVNLETASVDGFSVLWAQGSGGPAECHIAVRFNFLSTDFSHSKGVKGILSRLCAKTEVIATDSLYCAPDVPEIYFCNVKVFRDHGAERKLFNDVDYVKKTIDKLKQQIAQAETRMKDSGKRKRSGSITTKVTRSSGPGKALKHTAEEDLPFKLQTMQDMFASTRPVSALYVRGQEQDDPDLHPIQLTGEPLDLVKVESEESTAWQLRIRGCSIAGTSTLMSPLPSPGSV